MSSLYTAPSLLLLLLVLPWSVHGQQLDALSPEVEARLGLPTGAGERLVLVATAEDRGDTPQQALVNAPDIVSLHAAHVGGQRLLFRVGFARPPEFAGAHFIIYLDLDNDPETGRRDKSHQGIDLMIAVSDDALTLSPRNAVYGSGAATTRGARVGDALYVSLDAPLPSNGETVSIGVHLLSQRGDGRSDYLPHQVAALPHAIAQVPALTPGRGGSIRTLEDYRYHDDLVKYEKLQDKGFRAEQVLGREPFTPGRACPEPTFTTACPNPQKPGALDTTTVQVSLLEELGVARSDSPISFGFPCPEGGLFDLGKLRVVGPGDEEIPAQFTATAFWPNGSLKWVLVDFLTDLAAGEEKACAIDLGDGVTRRPVASPLRVTDGPDRLTINTGPLRATVDKRRFALLSEASFDADGDGQFVPGEQVLQTDPKSMTLVDERGKAFSSTGAEPDVVKIQEQGPYKVVLRVEGKYASDDGDTYMRYVARLTFRAGSSRVSVAWTHVNDYVQTEFTDFSSLNLPLTLAGGLEGASVYIVGEDDRLRARDGNRFALLQQSDQKSLLQAASGSANWGRAPGIMRCAGGGGPVTLAIHDFWQRWPKGLSCDGRQAHLQLLPTQPGPDYGADLPHYLLFNLVSGKYRLKWGMAFTERFTLEFDPRISAQELHAEVSSPIVPVLPASWYARTRALVRVATPLGEQFALWDKYVAEGFRAHMARKERAREYGFLNYGDWYGERGRNWGNNEYDLAHGLLQQFLRTGEREYFRWALCATRHQADVDIIHAYPDRFYVGGMMPHSVGHTGAWSQNLEHGTWHARYDPMATAANGHNWADGLVDAWCLTGEAGIMHSALKLGEHIAWAMSPSFKALGTHERSAGWSLRTIMAIYRQTYDPQYLAAAKRIAAVALKEQDLGGSGTWPHELPLDHAAGQTGVMGNNLFLIGILLSGLQAYHEACEDPATAASIIAGAGWIAKSWDEAAGGWPYSATPEGAPVYKATSGVNMLIIQPLAYVAELTDDENLWHIVNEAFTAVAVGGPDSFGKSLAQKIHFAGGTLALLQNRHAQASPDGGASLLSGDPAWYAARMAKTPDATRHSVRAPDGKVFFAEFRAPRARLSVLRTPHGAMTKRSPTGTLRVLDAQGATVGEDTYSTDSAREYERALQGRPGDRLKVLINDDQRGVWSLSGEGLAFVMQTVPGFRIGGVGKGRYHFMVPAGTREFRLKLVGVHTGPYGAVVLTPAGQIAGQHQDTNPGSALIQGAPAGPAVPPNHPERGALTIRPAATDTDRMWSVVLWAQGDIGVELAGVPPYLALSEGDWFEPE